MLFFDGVWANALAAADFDAALVRPSVSVLDAAVAAFALVCFFGASVCDNALPAADLDALLVDPDESVCDAFFATG